jgi:hypothetical protein
MMMVNCNSIKDSILNHMAEQTFISQTKDLCVVTLPIKTLDGRLVDVFIDERQADYYVVHDGGKAANELILQGGKITPSAEVRLATIATNMGVSWADEMFQVGCKIDTLHSAALSVAMCSCLAMTQLLEYGSETIQEPVHEQFGAVLKRWTAKRHFRMKEGLAVAGTLKKQLKFDFAAYPKTTEPIVISILSPAVSAISAADRFALKTVDLEKTVRFKKWRSVAVQTHAEVWSAEARDLVEKCADAVIEIRSGDKITEGELSEYLGNLAA